MDIITPFLIAFVFVFLSELGDKTQLLILSFSTKLKTFTIIVGVALGSLFSHGIAILFGSTLGNVENNSFKYIMQILTLVSFIVIGIYILFSNNDNESTDNNSNVLKKFSKLKINYILIIAISIILGELGDKTFFASMGLGVNYPSYKVSLILGAVLGMVISNCIAIFLGKLISSKLNPNIINKLSGGLFMFFGIIGFIIL